MNYVYYSSTLSYPTDIFNYSPSELYPEYPFSSDKLAGNANSVYTAIRKIFHDMNLDKNNYGTKEWNPLGKWINSGDTVVLKPNFVMHKNGSNNPNDLDSLVTHPSIIRCILDYCYIALKNSGIIIVGDAPVKDCNFCLLMKNRNYIAISDFYKSQGINIDFVDFRGPEEEGGQYKNGGTGILVNLNDKSYFYNCNHNESKYRIPNYDSKKVTTHHCGIRQEYLINSIVLNADVIINLPKPKTHRKNGFTGALKNFVGINYSKEYLPHHTEGSIASGGDEYLHDGIIRQAMSKLRKSIDNNRIKLNSPYKNTKKYLNRTYLEQKHNYLWKVYNMLSVLDNFWMKITNKNLIEQAREGCWYGNDTLWRTVLDLNYCIMYADKNGNIKNNQQRVIIHLGDMVISGEKEGPMAPSPKQQHMLLFSENATIFDCILTKIMGFDYTKFKGLYFSSKNNFLCNIGYEEIKVLSNIESFTGKLESIKFSDIVSPFQPSKGWINYVELEDNLE